MQPGSSKIKMLPSSPVLNNTKQLRSLTAPGRVYFSRCPPVFVMSEHRDLHTWCRRQWMPLPSYPPANLTWNLFSGLRIWTYRGQFGAKSFTAQARRMVWWSWENWRRRGLRWMEWKEEKEVWVKREGERGRERGRNPPLEASDCSFTLNNLLKPLTATFQRNTILTSFYAEHVATPRKSENYAKEKHNYEFWAALTAVWGGSLAHDASGSKTNVSMPTCSHGQHADVQLR